MVRETLADMLALLGHQTEAADGAAAALKCLHERRFDVVFTDISMPDVDRHVLIGEMRQRWPGLLICIVTGYGPDDEELRNAQLAADALIGKPFAMKEVEELLSRVCVG